MQKKTIKTVLLVAVVALLGYGVALMQGARDPLPGDVGAPMHVSMAAFDRVTGTGVLRCGYYNAAPFLFINDETGRPGGIVSRYLDELRPLLGKRIELVLSMPRHHADDLKNSAVDAQCLTTLQGAAQLRHVDLGRPLFSVPLYLYAPASSKLKSEQDVNTPNVRFATLNDGDALIRKQLFPATSETGVAVDTNINQFYLAVANGAADVLVADPASVQAYALSHPENALRKISSASVGMRPYYIATSKGDPALRQLIDDAVLYVQAQNSVGRFIRAFDSSGKMIYAPSAPFVSPSAR